MSKSSKGAYDLKPCPFCGSSAAVTEIHSTEGRAHTWHRIECSEHAHCPVPVFTLWGELKEVVIAWNTRNGDVPMPAVRVRRRKR